MKRKTTSLVLTLLILSFQSSFSLMPINKVNATDVGGVFSEDTIWTLAESPYVVVSDVIVKENATLTIQPGVEVRFDGNYSVTVYGSFWAEGTEANRIVFTSNKPEPNPGDWGTLKFVSTSNETFVLRYCLIEFATDGVTIESKQKAVIENSEIANNFNSGIHILGQSDLLASGNVIRYNGNGITGSGDIISGIVVSNNSILYNDKYGVYLETEGSVTYPRAPIENIVIFNNNVSFNEYGIHLFSQSQLYTEFGLYISNVTVSRNTVYFNDYGIYFKTFGYYDTSMHNVRISHNHVFFGKYGIYFDAGGNWYRYVYDITVFDNIVSSNEIGIYYDAHHFDLVSFDLTVTDNVFSSNYMGISIKGTAKINVTRNSISYNAYGVEFNASKGNLARYNDVYRNIFYGMHVTENATVDAEYNYWGDANGPSHELNPEGKGNRVNGNGTDLDYEPFLQNAVGSINDSPIATLEIDRRKVAVNQTIMLNASNSTDDQHIDRYFFNFGDGTNSSWTTSPFVTHAYSSPGNYTLFLIVIDNLGAISRNYPTSSVTVSAEMISLVVSVYSNSSLLVFPDHMISLSIFVTDGDYPIPNATVMLTSNIGGTFLPSTGVTNANGYFNATFIPPTVTRQTRCIIIANASEIDYAGAQGQMELLLMPPSKKDGGFDPRLLAVLVIVAIVVVIVLVVKRR